MSSELDDWFAEAGPREGDLRQVDALIMAAAPGIDRRLVPMGATRALGYGVVPHRPGATGEATSRPLIALAADQRHLTLHVSAVVDGGYLAESRAGELGDVSCGRSCLRFGSLDRVDTVALDRLVRDAVAVTAAGRNTFPAG